MGGKENTEEISRATRGGLAPPVGQWDARISFSVSSVSFVVIPSWARAQRDASVRSSGAFDEHARRQKVTNTVTSSRRGGAYSVGWPSSGLGCVVPWTR